MIALEGFPIEGRSRRKFEAADLKIQDGDLAVENGDLAVVKGIECLAQHIETAVCVDLFEGSHKRADFPEEVALRLKENIISNNLGDYFDAIISGACENREIEIEFAATGYPGTYIRKMSLDGPFGKYDCVTFPKQNIVEIQNIDEEVIRYLTKNPIDLHKLHPRRFEELVAEIVVRMGYDVQLTPYSKDDGVDIFAIRSDALQKTLTVIDCKHYSATRTIGPGLIRTIAGLREQHQASVGMIVTTSHFTEGARNLQLKKWPYEVSLADFETLKVWLKEFGWIRHAIGNYSPN